MVKERVKVINDKETPVPKEILAEAIVRISESMVKLHKSGLNEKAVIALVKDYTGYSKAMIKIVLDSLADLKRAYCR
jgi:hypothetical protein